MDSFEIAFQRKQRATTLNLKRMVICLLQDTPDMGSCKILSNRKSLSNNSKPSNNSSRGRLLSHRKRAAKVVTFWHLNSYSNRPFGCTTWLQIQICSMSHRIRPSRCLVMTPVTMHTTLWSQPRHHQAKVWTHLDPLSSCEGSSMYVTQTHNTINKPKRGKLLNKKSLAFL